MDPLLVLIALAVTGSVALGGWWLQQARSASSRVVRARIEARPGALAGPQGVLRTQRRGLPLAERLPISREGRERTQLALDRAGLRWRAAEFLSLRLGLALVLAIVASVLVAIAGAPPLLSILFGLLAMFLGWHLPGAYLGRRRRKRMATIEQQLPAALTAIAKSLRAGSGLLQAIAFAADESPDPFGAELSSTLRDLQLGAEPVEAFEALSTRVGVKDLQIAVTAIIIQRTVGGNLSEILNNVTETIRERAKIQREVRVLVTRQMLQANLTAALPVVITLLFIGINPDIGGLLLTTTVGNIALGFAAVCEVLGVFIVRRLAVIEV
jgi:tight adherence protein B